ncbi:phospholipase A and acyltransferase 1-like [Babylonia areolata]|uniref:phospholipase A and acyltransferase 1-like n=1 Tax=Babylonia areolata TaxID=304850 RepID=UPI003FD06634
MLSPLRVFLPAEQLLSREYCKAGDLLEIDHKLYAHWAVYVGNHEVVHIPESYVNQTVVERGLLASVAGECLVRVNNKEVPAKERGLTSLPPDEVVDRAIGCVGTTVCSNIVVNNSEHFVTRLKYGVGWSDQAKALQHSMSLLSSSPTPTSPVLVAKAHQNIWSEIHTILSSSPPVSTSPPVSPSSCPAPSSSSSPSSTHSSSASTTSSVCHPPTSHPPNPHSHHTPSPPF